MNNEKIKSIMNSSNFVNLLSEDIKKSIEAINNSISILKETLNERLKTLYDKISNAFTNEFGASINDSNIDINLDKKQFIKKSMKP